MAEPTMSTWGVNRLTDDKLIDLLRNNLACEGAVQWAMREALARLLERPIV